MSKGWNLNIYKNKLILQPILFLSLFIRVFNLGTKSLWLDECASIITASLSVSEIVRNVPQGYSPPWYYLILHYWTKLFGISEFAVRFPSLIFGVLVVLMIYLITRAIWELNYTYTKENKSGLKGTGL